MKWTLGSKDGFNPIRLASNWIEIQVQPYNVLNKSKRTQFEPNFGLGWDPRVQIQAKLGRSGPKGYKFGSSVWSPFCRNYVKAFLKSMQHTTFKCQKIFPNLKLLIRGLKFFYKYLVKLKVFNQHIYCHSMTISCFSTISPDIF